MFKHARKAAIALFAASALALTACGDMTASDADTVSENLSTEAENFKIQRTIVFYNGITDKKVAVIEGACSIERTAEMMQAICKVGPNQYTRDEIGRSDNMTYFSLQTDSANVSEYHKKIIIKPEGAILDYDVKVSK